MHDLTTTFDPNRNWRLRLAAADFFCLLNKSYPRKPSLELAGNRHALDASERLLLSRGIFSQKEALARLGKRRIIAEWRREILAVDGHNVQITIESRLQGKPLLKANDGALRDIAGLSSRYRMSQTSDMAIDMIFAFLKLFSPREVLFLFDEPMSRSGELAAIYGKRLAGAGIAGEAKTSRVPEREFPFERCVAASSDRAVIDSALRWTDLACLIIDYFGPPEITADFSGFLLAGSEKTGIGTPFLTENPKEKTMAPVSRPDSIEGFMTTMSQGFNAERAGQLKAVMQFDFSGEKEGSCHFEIQNGQITAKEGAAANPDLTVASPFGVWMDIITGEANGQMMFMQQKFTASGDFSLLMRLNELFGAD